MKIKLHEIAVKDVYDGYHDFGADNGVVGYDSKLNIRPKYQRNFVYNLDQSKAVMNSVLHGLKKTKILILRGWLIPKPDE